MLQSVIIPDYITVHLGAPTASAANVRIRFTDYIKNVVSHEIYSTWPQASLEANIHAIITFVLNRVFTEWYRVRGYNFDVTNDINYDMKYVNGGGYFDNISQIVDRIFNVYVRRHGFVNPYFTAFCAGQAGTCQHGGMSQWGTVTLANQGLTPLQILRRYYTPDVELVTTNNIGGITESFPGTALQVGSSGASVKRMQDFLNRIRVNYPLIPRIENPNGVFGTETQQAVRTFQSLFNLTVDGIIGRATWNRISELFTGITKLGELQSEGIRYTIGQNPPNVVLSQGARGENVLELQFILNMLAEYYDSIPTVIQDGIFDARTKNSVVEFQRTFGLSADGVVGPATWNKLYAVYRGIENNVSVPPITERPPLQIPAYPGSPLTIGSSGQNVHIMQEALNVIHTIHPNVPLIDVDGNFGPATQNAVKAFQRSVGLAPDGIIGPTTWGKIAEQYQIAINTPSTPPPELDYFFVTVMPNDTLWLLAQKFGTTVDAIRQLNNLTNDVLNVGQVLKIPNPSGGGTQPPTYVTHTVVSGDTLWLLAQRFGTTVDAIMSLNNLTSTVLNIGQVLRIPTTGETPTYITHTVQSGDTLWLLAQRFGTTVDAIMSLNNLTSTALNIGQVLRIPTSGDGGGTTPRRTIIIDAGHGGSDPGAVFEGRQEKDDNLRLALEVQRLLQAQGQNVVMTRSTDVFVPLEERSAISNRNNADLFVSLHRNASTNLSYNGLDNFIYTNAPQTTAQKAQNVVDEVASVGVQSNRGVSRANFSVLRRTVAPAMLLEMGFITNARDNQLFDQNFNAYAQAIVRGIMRSI